MKRPLSLYLTNTSVFRQRIKNEPSLKNWLVRNNWCIFSINYFCQSADEKSKQIKNSPAPVPLAPPVQTAVYTEKLNMYLFCALKLEKLSKHLNSFFDNVPIKRIWFRLVELSSLCQLFQQSAFSSSCRLFSKRRIVKLKLKIPSSLWSEKVWQNRKVFTKKVWYHLKVRRLPLLNLKLMKHI